MKYVLPWGLFGSELQMVSISMGIGDLEHPSPPPFEPIPEKGTPCREHRFVNNLTEILEKLKGDMTVLERNVRARAVAKRE